MTSANIDGFSLICSTDGSVSNMGSKKWAPVNGRRE